MSDTGRDPHTNRIRQVFIDAINHLDKSEPVIRDLIESRLMDIGGISGTKVSAAASAATSLAKEISVIRRKHIREAFQYLRDNLPSDI
jgi:hypothetical protein